nr:glycosyltransferase family 2 protein [Leucobacter weissii]
MRDSVRLLELEFGHLFRAFLPVEHPAGLPDEIPGKGGNITYGGRYLARWVEEQGIDPESVLVTTLDCDNRVHPAYFDYVSYEFVRARDPQRLSFQPISLFVNNVWHAPAPTRVIAAGNSLWNLTSTMRPFSLRNFASHTQPLAALIEMDFWSRRTIVEDGHQYWRSFFHFRGDYGVVPVHVPIYQDAVLAENLPRTLRAQFKQLCRWAYGASDVPFVGVRMLERERAAAPFGATLRRFILLLDSHVTLSTIAPMLAFGVWIPSWFAELFGKTLHEPSESILVNGISETERLAQILGLGTAQVTTPSVQAFIQPIPDFADRLAALLPFLVDSVRPLATVAVVVTIVLTLLTLPPRPPEVSRLRNLGMIAQWVLLPITMICYNALSAITSQLRLLLGRYRESFDVTEKAAVPGANPDDARFDVEMWSSHRRSSTG